MKAANLASLALLLPAFLAACAPARESARYQPPARPGAETRALVPGDWQAVSLRILEELRREPFAALSEVGATPWRRLSFRFETGQAELYVDCGERSGLFVDPHGKETSSRFPLAADADYRGADERGRPLAVRHASHLAGDVTIQLFPRGGETEVALDVAYDLTLSDKAQPLDSDGRGMGGLESSEVRLRFGSSTAAAGDGTLETPACVSKGLIESRILAAARP